MNEIKIKLNIDGIEVSGFQGQTILDIARENGIDIPTLCHDERVEMYGSCGLCVVEAEGTPKLLRSCSTYAADGMIIKTNTERLRQNRKTALELLLSDHTGDCRAPCSLACSAQTDCQGYVKFISEGKYDEALKLIKEKIPLPASIGRVCPHPCEEACRRELVEEPISICALKRFAGDVDLAQGELYTAEVGISTEKNAAIIGGGPGGLTAAYFLRLQGHGVTIYDAMPQMGGMLRYGIPEYRLPKKILQREIDSIEKIGVTFKNNTKIGRDVTLEYLRDNYDAVSAYCLCKRRRSASDSDFCAILPWSGWKRICLSFLVKSILAGKTHGRRCKLYISPAIYCHYFSICRFYGIAGLGNRYRRYRHPFWSLDVPKESVNKYSQAVLVGRGLQHGYVTVHGLPALYSALREQVAWSAPGRY